MPTALFNIFMLLIIRLALAENKSNTSCFSKRKLEMESFKNNLTRERVSQRKCKEYAEDAPCVVTLEFAVKIKYVEDVESYDFPHMALVVWKSSVGYQEICEGVLISPRFVLVPAHCSEEVGQLQIDHISTVTVRLGDHIAGDQAFDGINQVEILVRSTYKHPNYTNIFADNDIGLLELSERVNFTKYIRPACLWTGVPFHEHYGVSVTSSSTYNKYSLGQSKKLQKFNMEIITTEDCKTKGQQNVDDNQICAVYPSGLNDTHCLDVSGVPLQVVSDDNPCVSHIVGISSFLTTICGNEPSIFARIPSYLKWIESIVWPRK